MEAPRNTPHCHSHGKHTHWQFFHSHNSPPTHPTAHHRRPPRITVPSLSFPPRYLDTHSLYQISHALSLSHTHTCTTLLPHGTTLAHAYNFAHTLSSWSMHLTNDMHIHNSSGAHRRPHTRTHTPVCTCTHRSAHPRPWNLRGRSPGVVRSSARQGPRSCLARSAAPGVRPDYKSPSLGSLAWWVKEELAGRERDLPGGSAPGPGTAENLARPSP